MTNEKLYLGIDLGTSGCRATAIDSDKKIQAEARIPFPDPDHDDNRVQQDPEVWWQAVCQLLTTLFQQIPASQISAIAIDGTSSTLLLTDKSGAPIGPALMYNDARATAEAERMERIVPANSAAHGPSSGLAKLLWLQRNLPSESIHHVMHQADWILGKLTGRYGLSDTNNCLKLGYNPLNGRWPDWLGHTGAFREWFPKVYQPGTPVAMISPEIAGQFGLNPNTQLVAGTTDSTAAIIATGATQPGEAVTSLGSTLVMKVVTTMPVFDPKYGIYSQPLGPLWLVGGGSNSGGRVLRHYFDNQQLEMLSQQIDPNIPSELDYYPLLTPGERFPVCDPRLAPRLTPRPENDAAFLHGLFVGMARIEHQAYQRLAELGAPYPTSIRSAGGGASNPIWTAIRQRILGVPVIEADHQEAAYGSALLAMKAITGIQ